jgi:hypothetical protein
MDARLVDQVVGSPVFARLILLACISALFLYLKRKDTEGHSGAFLALLGILLARDFLSAYYLSPELFFISDVFYLGFSLFILLAPFDGSRIVMVLALGFNVLAAALFLGITVFNLPFVIPIAAFGYLLVADAVLAGLVSFMYRKDRSTTARHLVSLLWPLAVLFLLVYSVLAILLGYDDPLFLGLVLPVSYGWLFAAALLSLGIQEAEMVSALGYYEAAIDSLYSMFLSIGSALEDGLSGQEVLKRLNGILVSETGADGGIVLLPEGDEVLAVNAYAGFFPPLLPLPEYMPQSAEEIETYMKKARFNLGEGVLGEVGKAGKNVYCPRAEQDLRFVANGSNGFLRISSFMAVPLMIKDRILGISALVRTSKGSEFKEADFDRFKLLANFGSFAISTLLPRTGVESEERQLGSPAKNGLDGVLGEIRKSILPNPLPRYPGLSADGMTISSPGNGGAYYDLIQARKGKVIGVVAEAAGQGLGAALVLVMLRSVLQVLGRTDKDMATLLNWVNRILHGSIEPDLAPSLGLVCLNLQTRELEYAHTGNSGLLVYRHGSRTLDYISKASVPIGKGRLGDYERIRQQLHAGDMVVLFTEGVTGCTDGQGNRFGRKALSGTIIDHGDMDATGVLEGIHDALSTFRGTTIQQAGQTVLVMKVD